MPRATRLHAVAIVGLVLLSVVGSLLLTRPPAARPVTAPADVFSAERAMLHVAVIARRPHPIGSEEHAVVRDYVARTLMDLGLDVDVQKTTGVTAKYGVAGAVENVVGRLHGAGPSTGAVLLAAHYDSVAAGPGAGDDASGVAAIFETLRALRAGPPLENDLLVLLSDGEEAGLLGASAFVSEHPWAKDVRLAINFEARGNSGVPSLFETSPENGLLVREAARAVPALVGSSLSYEVYKRMPNDTDATVFKAHGLPALNFAFIGNWAAYHTPSDDAEHLDRGSLQGQGTYALGLARRFGRMDLGSLRAPDAVFFSLPGGLFVHYGGAVAFGFVVLAVLLVAFGTRRATRTRRATLLGAAAGFGFFLVSLVVVGAVGGAVAFLAGWLHAEVLPEGDVLGSAAYAWAIVCVALGVWAAAYALVRDRLSVDDVGLGAAAVLVALAIAACFQVPGTSYLFLWPSLGCATCAASRREGAGPTAMASLAAVACSLPAVLIVVPLLHGAYEGLGVSVGGGVLMGILVGLLAGSLAAPLESLRSFASARSLVASPLVVGLALFGLGMAGTRTSVEHPKASQLWYVLDAGTSRARWASSAARSDAWTAELVGTHPARAPLFPGLSRMWLQGDAVAVATAAPPELTVVEAADAAGGRTFRIEARAGRAGALDFETLSPVVEATVEGKAVPPRSAGGAWRLTYLDVGEAGITLALRVRGRGPMTLSVTERWAGVPVMAGKSARPPWSVPQHDGDQTVIRRDFVL